MRDAKLGLVIAALIGGCTGGGMPDSVTPPAPSEVGQYLLRSIEGRSLPTTVSYCHPDCSGTRLVFPDTFEILDVPTLRFRWAVTFAEDATSPAQRIQVVGTLVVANVGFYLVSENHPVLPASIYAGLFYLNINNNHYELQAKLPWNSVGTTAFAYERLSR